MPETGLVSRNSDRRGRTVIHSNSKVLNSFNKFSAKAWNELPKHIRNIQGQSTDTFKKALDIFLSKLEDNPHCSRETTRRCSNDVMSKEDHRRMGGSPIPTTL